MYYLRLDISNTLKTVSDHISEQLNLKLSHLVFGNMASHIVSCFVYYVLMICMAYLIQFVKLKIWGLH